MAASLKDLLLAQTKFSLDIPAIATELEQSSYKAASIHLKTKGFEISSEDLQDAVKSGMRAARAAMEAYFSQQSKFILVSKKYARSPSPAPSLVPNTPSAATKSEVSGSSLEISQTSSLPS